MFFFSNIIKRIVIFMVTPNEAWQCSLLDQCINPNNKMYLFGPSKKVKSFNEPQCFFSSSKEF